MEKEEFPLKQKIVLTIIATFFIGSILMNQVCQTLDIVSQNRSSSIEQSKPLGFFIKNYDLF